MTHLTEDLTTASIATYPDLSGKVAIITGSSQGIGAATALALAINGVRVVVNGRDAEAVAAMVARIRDVGGEAAEAPGDASDVDVLTGLSLVAERAYGPVDIFGAFIGGSASPPGPTAGISLEDWNATVRTNLTAAFLGLKTFLPRMIDRERGSIITLSSAAARLAGGGPIGAPTAYAAAKAGLVRLTQEAAKEAGPHGVRVNCIAPSTILTDRLQRLIPSDRKRQMTTMHPLGRLGVPADVANAALFLASESASWITGVTLDVAGGQVMA
jgi:3-oxoacyl-[acyl-carrier protein] reductase